MKILIAPDKFKGSLTAQQVCSAISEGLLSVDPGLVLHSIPLADGGEGTCDLLTEISKGSKIKIRVLDPLFREVESEYGLDGAGQTAFIEMAKASGLQLLNAGERNPIITTTYGTGQLIQHALSHGVKKIILGIGGSATNDGGMGMAEALGFSFRDSENLKLEPIGKNLIRVRTIVKDHIDSRLDRVEFVVIYDVKNPLYGEQGAAFVFGPQKGATTKATIELDAGLRHFAKIVQEQFGVNINFPGAGAAGGLGGGAKLFLNARFSPGIEFVLQYTNLAKHIQDSDLIITGEGKIDEQTFSGKVVQGVADLARKYHKRCVAFTGKSDLTPNRLAGLGVNKVIALADGTISEKEAMENAFEVLRGRVMEYYSLYPSPSPEGEGKS